MRVVPLEEIRRAVDPRRLIPLMREAAIAQSRGECEVPMPMHLAVPERGAEIHVKSAHRSGGAHFVLKAAGTFPERAAGGVSSGTGMMLLFSAESGEPVAYLADDGYLTDLRTAAAAAMAAAELGRRDENLGILGSGIQARLQALLHREVLPLRAIHLWGRTPARQRACVEELGGLLPGVEVRAASSPGEVARDSTLIVTATASRRPLLASSDLRPGAHVSAVGSDSPGKQELDPGILRGCALLLVDSLAQCERLGELQHAPSERTRAVELGSFCESPRSFDRGGITVCDFTGLGIEDLFAAEECYSRLPLGD